MSRARQAAVAVAAFRIAYGAGLVAAPAALAKNWLGPDGTRPPAGVALRALGAREVLLFGGAIAALLRDEPARPWLLAGVAGDLFDIAATAGAASHLPEGAAPKTAAVAGASALLGAGVAAALER
jgi:hypothetical protein